jgi:lactoylglutathione lyase
MFERDTLTFNSGLDSNASKLNTFTEVRDLQRELKAQSVPPTPRADETSTGPASFASLDHDGNPILVDEHV